MKTIELNASLRNTTGKKASSDVRKGDNVPAVVYHDGASTHIEVAYKEVQKALFTSDTYIVKLNVEGQLYDTIVRETQYHPVTDRIIHVDFLQVSADKPVAINLPLVLEGTPVGVTKGGKLLTKLRKIKVRGTADKLPENIKVNVSQLDLGGTIKVGEANIQGLQVVTSPSAAIASVEIPRALRGGKK
ncbi:MAG: 50S ribosomal protein L25 [Bacteroidia bacterium]|nr:50S ribosomal protein L25 [Bacteroidia bacterium]